MGKYFCTGKVAAHLKAALVSGQVAGIWTEHTNHLEHSCMYASFALSAILRLVWFKTGQIKSDVPIQFVDLALAMAFFGEGLTWHLHSTANSVCTPTDTNCKYEEKYLPAWHSMNKLTHEFLQLYANLAAAVLVL
jgi:hypothetical protein